MTPQQPLGSGFGAASTAAETIKGIDLTGKVAIVTGGGAGIGIETSRALRSAGATVIVPARDPAKAAAALTGIAVEIAPMDLTDPASITAFATTFLHSGRPLHLLVASAGIIHSVHARFARLRIAIRDEPPRSLPTRDAAVACATPRAGRPRRLRLVVGTSLLECRV